MAATRSFALGDNYDRFIDAQVKQGRFGNATEVVRAGLRMLQDYETRMRELRLLIDEADASLAAGKGKSYDDPVELIEAIVKRGQAKSKTATGK
ncbi:MAG: type II toxin-antitoxin system ParD family antitoxin [Candidatus Omnitrophota bacterium]